MIRVLEQAPALEIDTWLNTDKDIHLSELKGKAVVIYVFQMLCYGCVHFSIPQLKKLNKVFDKQQLEVLAIHSVFEHHSANNEETLKAFLFENKITVPVGIDAENASTSIPKTMSSYRLKGTPSLVLIDKKGFLRRRYFGHLDDIAVGAEIMALIKE